MKMGADITDTNLQVFLDSQNNIIFQNQAVVVILL